jgi:PHD-finger
VNAGPGASQRVGVSTVESHMPDQAAFGGDDYWSFSQEREQLIDDYMKKHPVAEEVQAEEEELLCICLQAEDDRAMIQCSNGDACRLEWYHFDCLGLTAEDIPEGDEAWFCPECVKEGNNMDDGPGAAVINMTPRTELKPRSAKAKASKAIARDLEDLGGVIDDGDSDEDSPAPSPSIKLKPWSADMIQSFVENSDNIRDYDLTTLATAKAALRARAAEPIGQPRKQRGGSNIDTTYSSMYKSPNCRSWTAEEEQHLTEVVKECSDAGLAGEALWAAAHPKLVARGVNRPMGGMKMRWCRGLRDQTKIDERRKKNKKLLTAVQKPKVDREPGAPKKGRFKGKAFHAMRREAPVKVTDPSQQPDVAAPKSAPLSVLSGLPGLPAIGPLGASFPIERQGQPGRRKRAMSV